MVLVLLGIYVVSDSCSPRVLPPKFEIALASIESKSVFYQQSQSKIKETYPDFNPRLITIMYMKQKSGKQTKNSTKSLNSELIKTHVLFLTR